MFKLESVEYRHGSITFMPPVEDRPETTTTSKMGNVTINNINAAVKGEPACYKASFMYVAKFVNEGHQFSNIFSFDAVVSNEDDWASYRSVEDAAARMVPGMLRAIADMIEANLPDFEKRE